MSPARICDGNSLSKKVFDFFTSLYFDFIFGESNNYLIIKIATICRLKCSFIHFFNRKYLPNQFILSAFRIINLKSRSSNLFINRKFILKFSHHFSASILVLEIKFVRSQLKQNKFSFSFCDFSPLNNLLLIAFKRNKKKIEGV